MGKITGEAVCFFSFSFSFLFNWRIIGFSNGSVGKESACNAEDARNTGLIPGSGRSSGEGNGNPPQYSCLKISVDRGAWQATYSPRVTKSWTQPSTGQSCLQSCVGFWHTATCKSAVIDMHCLPLEPPSHHLTPPLQVITECWAGLPVLSGAGLFFILHWISRNVLEDLTSQWG